MSEKKHIDRLFQEGLKDFEANPSDAVWKKIEANLNNKKKRRIIPIWWRYAGVAALLLMLLTIGGILFNDAETVPSIQVVETEDVNEGVNHNEANSNDNTVISNSSNGVEKETQNTKTTPNNLIQQNKTAVAKTLASENNSKSQVDKNPEINFNQKLNNGIIAKNKEDAVINKLHNNINNNSIASIKLKENSTAQTLQNRSTKANPITNDDVVTQTKNELNKNKNQTIAKNEGTKENLTIEEAIEENKELLEDTQKTSRWAVTPNAAPVYFNTLGQGSSIDPQFNSNSKSGEINMSYGISASYALNDKISIRSGIHKVSLGYNTNDVIVFQTAGVGIRSSLQNVRESSNSVSIASDNVSIASESNFSSVPVAFNATNTTLNQAFGYIEIPLEVQYALSNKKLGINVIGGFSSLFLNNNEIFSEAENGNRFFLGEANNLNKVSYSANFGLGFNYQISKRLDLNLEPMFKYQFNTFNNTSGNFTPFFIGVYSGFAIKF